MSETAGYIAIGVCLPVMVALFKGYAKHVRFETDFYRRVAILRKMGVLLP